MEEEPETELFDVGSLEQGTLKHGIVIPPKKIVRVDLVERFSSARPQNLLTRRLALAKRFISIVFDVSLYQFFMTDNTVMYFSLSLQTYKILLRMRSNLSGCSGSNKSFTDILPIPFPESFQTFKKNLVFLLCPSAFIAINAPHNT